MADLMGVRVEVSTSNTRQDHATLLFSHHASVWFSLFSSCSLIKALETRALSVLWNLFLSWKRKRKEKSYTENIESQLHLPYWLNFYHMPRNMDRISQLQHQPIYNINYIYTLILHFVLSRLPSNLLLVRLRVGSLSWLPGNRALRNLSYHSTRQLSYHSARQDQVVVLKMLSRKIYIVKNGF